MQLAAVRQARARALPDSLSGRALDELTPEQVQAYKELARSAPPAASPRALAQSAGVGRLVAEGDSWFDFPIGTDLIDCLRREHGFKIECFAKAGDTLENMIFGTKLDRRFQRQAPSIQQVLSAVERIRPKVFLFSSGGNDVAGDELASFLKHADSGLTALREDYAVHLIDVVFRRYLEALIARVHQASPSTLVLMHGYGRPIPSGQGVDLLFFTFAGPWLKPAFSMKGLPQRDHRPTVVRLIERYNQMLMDLMRKHPQVFLYVNLPDTIKDSHWRDELHLKNSAFKRCADRIAAAIDALDG